MTVNLLSKGAKRFLQDDIASLERLDVLLLLQRAPERWWAAQELGTALGMSSEVVQTHLDALASLGFLNVRIAESLIYCYHPARSDLGDLVAEIGKASFRDRGALAAELLVRPRDGVRLFADAFRLRKARRETNDG